MTLAKNLQSRRRLPITLLLAGLLAGGCVHRDPATLEEIPADVRQSVDAAVERGHRVGIVVGLVNPRGRFFHASGLTETNGNLPMTPATVVGIGSLTKLFTAELLADAVVDGRLMLATPVATLLPVDDPAGTQLWQLAAHRADLPRKLSTAALEHNDAGALYATLATPRSLPAEPAYSNVGYAVLGEALAASAGLPLAQLVERDLTAPMGLEATGYAPDTTRLAMPHQGRTSISPPAPPLIARGAGGLYSSAEDLLAFVDQHLSPVDEKQRARTALLTGSSPLPGGAEALGWKRHRKGDIDVYHHGGDGNGYQAFIAFRPANATGVVLLTNSSADDALQQVAHHLLDPGVPLPAFDHPPALLLAPEQLVPFAGRYRIVGDPNTIELTVVDDGLHYIERGADDELVRASRLFALAPRKFELREIPVIITFDESGAGSLTAGDQTFVIERM